MKKKDIENLKNQGARDKLLQKANSLLWEIKKACEDASKERYKNLPKEIERIHQLASDALECWQSAKRGDAMSERNDRLKKIDRGECDRLRAERDAAREVVDDKRRLARDIDVLLNGQDAAEQPALCDIVAQLNKIKQPDGLLTYLAKLRATNRALVDILDRLAGEVNACVGMTGIREAIGNTNFSVIEALCKEAKEAIKGGQHEDQAD
jgi:hypothetical protein